MMQSIDIDFLKELQNNKSIELKIIDIRSHQEYNQERIPGAISMPLEQLMNRQYRIPKHPTCVIYSQGGNRSYYAAKWMQTEGFKKIYHLEGGLNGWQGYKAHGHFSLNLDLLSPDATFTEALQMAIAMEENLKLFYIDLSEFCSDDVVTAILERLTKFEDQHMKHLISQFGIENSDQLYLSDFNKKYGKRLEGGGELEGTKKFFSQIIKKPEDILKIGIAMEAQALDFYSRLAYQTTLPKNKSLFQNMMNEEQAHLSYISRELERYLTV